MSAAFEIARLVAVVALLCAAAAVATPPGRLPLALRGLAKVIRAVPVDGQVSAGRRALALALLVAAVALALL